MENNVERISPFITTKDKRTVNIPTTRPRLADGYDMKAYKLFCASPQGRARIENEERDSAKRLGMDPEHAIDALWSHARIIASPGVLRSGS